MLKIKLILLFFFSWIFIIQAQTNLPDPPAVDTISVEPITNNGDVYISWFPMDTNQIVGYILYKKNSTLWINLDTIWGATSTYYFDSNSNAIGEPESYCLRSLDTANSKSLFSDVMTTMYTFPYIEEENCDYHIRVHWTPYVGWSNIKKYDIYCSVNDGPFSFLTTVNGNVNEYYHKGLSDSTSYSYYVKAYSQDGRTSRSNSVRTFIDFPNPPKFINADFASVEGDGIKLSFTLDTASEIKNYRIVRAKNINGVYQTIKEFFIWDFDKLTYTDYTVNIYKPYYYRLDAIDDCGNEIFSSNIAKTIKIEVSGGDDFSPKIWWDKYIDWLGDDIEYRLYRIINSDAKLIFTTFSGINYYKDKIPQEEIPKITGKLCYMVEAIEGNTNPYGIVGHSKSAIKCVEQQSYVVMPNAFTPNNDKINDIFKPLAIFINNENYNFKIYNRWGELVFDTKNPAEGWTGKNDNNKVNPEGVYYYLLQYQDFYGEIHYLSGEVTLIF